MHRHAFNATREAQREPILWPYDEFKSGSSHVGVRDRHFCFKWIGPRGQDAILLFWCDGVGTVHERVQTRNDLLIAIDAQRQTPAAITGLDGLIDVTFFGENLAVSENLESVLGVLFAGGHVEPDANEDVAFHVRGWVEDPPVSFEAHVADAGGLSMKPLKNGSGDVIGANNLRPIVEHKRNREGCAKSGVERIRQSDVRKL